MGGGVISRRNSILLIGRLRRGVLTSPVQVEAKPALPLYGGSRNDGPQKGGGKDINVGHLVSLSRRKENEREVRQS